jgi:hypothetical protein
VDDRVFVYRYNSVRHVLGSTILLGFGLASMLIFFSFPPSAVHRLPDPVMDWIAHYLPRVGSLLVAIQGVWRSGKALLAYFNERVVLSKDQLTYFDFRGKQLYSFNVQDVSRIRAIKDERGRGWSVETRNGCVRVYKFVPQANELLTKVSLAYGVPIEAQPTVLQRLRPTF